MNVPLFLETLPIMAKGMIGIFAVTAVIIVCVLLLNRLTGGRKKTDSPET